MSHLPLFLMNRLKKTECVVFKLWTLYFQRIPFTDYIWSADWPLIDEALSFLSLTSNNGGSQKEFHIGKSTCCTAWSLVTVGSQHMVHCLSFKDSGSRRGPQVYPWWLSGPTWTHYLTFFDRWEPTNRYIFCTHNALYMTFNDRRIQQNLQPYL